MDGSLEMELLVEALSDSDAKIQEPRGCPRFLGFRDSFKGVYKGFL